MDGMNINVVKGRNLRWLKNIKIENLKSGKAREVGSLDWLLTKLSTGIIFNSLGYLLSCGSIMNTLIGIRMQSNYALAKITVFVCGMLHF